MATAGDIKTAAQNYVNDVVKPAVTDAQADLEYEVGKLEAAAMGIYYPDLGVGPEGSDIGKAEDFSVFDWSIPLDSTLNPFTRIAADQVHTTYFPDGVVPDTAQRTAWTPDKPADIIAPDGSTITGNWWDTKLNAPDFDWDKANDLIPTDLLERFQYDSDYLEYLETETRRIITNGSAFIAASVQEALWESSRERDLQTLQDALDAVDRTQARRGFPIPSSMLLAARNEVIKKYQDTYADRNKEITALIAERAHDAHKHSMTTGVQIEEIRSKITLAFAQLYWSALDAMIRKYLGELETKFRLIGLEAEFAKLTMEAQKANQDRDMKIEELDWAVDEFMRKIDQHSHDAKMKQWAVEVELEKLVGDWKIKYAELDMQKNLERLKAEVAQLGYNVDTWKTNYKGQMDAALKIIEHYQAVVLGYTGTSNVVLTNQE